MISNGLGLDRPARLLRTCGKALGREMSHPLVLAPSTRSSLRNGLQAGMAISLPGALFHPESVVENNKLTFTLGSVECKE